MSSDVSPLDMMDADEARLAEEAILTHAHNLRDGLIAFRDREGWRALGYPSMRVWASERLGKSISAAYRELKAGDLATIISANGDVTAIPESVLRPLAALEDNPEQVRLVWNAAVMAGGGQGAVTARHVKAAIAVIEEVAATGGVVTDALGEQSPIVHAVSAEAHELLMRQKAHIAADNGGILFSFTGNMALVLEALANLAPFPDAPVRVLVYKAKS